MPSRCWPFANSRNGQAKNLLAKPPKVEKLCHHLLLHGFAVLGVAHPVNEKTPKADAAVVVRGIGIIPAMEDGRASGSSCSRGPLWRLSWVSLIQVPYEAEAQVSAMQLLPLVGTLLFHCGEGSQWIRTSMTGMDQTLLSLIDQERMDYLSTIAARLDRILAQGYSHRLSFVDFDPDEHQSANQTGHTLLNTPNKEHEQMNDLSQFWLPTLAILAIAFEAADLEIFENFTALDNDSP
eukprot:s648_g38.t1